jgi:uncharacterized membrane protein YphA (DoxX/SURF4 family)
MSYLDKFSSFALVALFAFAGIDKLFHYQEFVTALASYRLVPMALASSLAPVVVGVELAIALGLAIRRWREAAALTAALLTTAFTVVLWIENRLGPNETCGCWFSVDLVPSRFHIVLNVVLVGVALGVWWSERSARRLPTALADHV